MSRRVSTSEGYLRWQSELWRQRRLACKRMNERRLPVLRTLRAGLAGFPLALIADALEREGWRYNVSPYFLAAIAGKESTFGKAACGGNAWGIASCGMTFPTFADGAHYTARLLRQNYIDDGLTTIPEIGYRYCVPPHSWIRDVTAIMRQYFGAAPVVTYPA